ncbi:MAG: hypothetical protein MUF64_04155 [Polyangiaceae bacterium]|jgi:hypothetical protein|nr:hypothetical protein [Polyangiaceae bacterium]
MGSPEKVLAGLLVLLGGASCEEGERSSGLLPSCADARCAGGSSGVGCEALQVASFRFSATANSGWFTASYSAGVEPSLGEGWQALGIKLKEKGGDLLPGVVDLSREPQDTGKCRHCVFVSYEGSGDHFQLALANRGVLEIEEVDTDRGILKGTLRGVTFQHLDEVALHSFQGVHQDQRCFQLGEAAVDTRPVPGQPCLASSDCPNAQLQVCDPASRRCVEVSCSPGETSCPAEGVCQTQDPFFKTGACYTRCAPFTSGACPEGQDCIPVDYVGKTGICKAQGPDTPEPVTRPDTGRSCEPRQIATGCGPGHVCATHAVYWHYDHCFRQCDYFGKDPGCPVGRCWLKLHTSKEIETTYLCGQGDCHFGGLCSELDDDLDGSAFGAPCDGEVGSSCGGDAQRTGICVRGSDGEVTCQRFCRLEGTDCPDGLACNPVILSPGTDEERSFESLGLGACTP